MDSMKIMTRANHLSSTLSFEPKSPSMTTLAHKAASMPMALATHSMKATKRTQRFSNFSWVWSLFSTSEISSERGEIFDHMEAGMPTSLPTHHYTIWWPFLLPRSSTLRVLCLKLHQLPYCTRFNTPIGLLGRWFSHRKNLSDCLKVSTTPFVRR